MSATVQIRDLDEEVHASLVRRVADAGLTVPELLRREVHRVAVRPLVDEWLERTRRRPSRIARAEVVEMLGTLDRRLGALPGLRCSIEVPA